MIKNVLKALGAVAIAGAFTLPVYASDFVGYESETIGTFGDIDTSIDDNLNDLFNDVGEVLDEDNIQDVEENNSDYIDRDSEVTDSLVDDVVQDVQMNSVDQDQIGDAAINYDSDIVQPFSNYNVYYGSISSTYLEFMRGFLPKLKFNDHYVCARTSQYDYIFAYGSELNWNGSFFSGSDITVVRWNTYNNGTFSSGIESSFNLYPASYLVYSDLSNIYPSLADTSGFTLRQIFILLIIICLCWTIDHMYQVRKVRRLK